MLSSKSETSKNMFKKSLDLGFPYTYLIQIVLYYGYLI